MIEQPTHHPETGDAAYRILRDLPLSRQTLGDIWDSYNEAKSVKSLKLHLERFDLPDDVEKALLAAKAAEPGETDVVIGAIHELSRLDPAILERVEKHPNLLRHLIEAARRERDTKHDSHESEPRETNDNETAEE